MKGYIHFTVQTDRQFLHLLILCHNAYISGCNITVYVTQYNAENEVKLKSEKIASTWKSSRFVLSILCVTALLITAKQSGTFSTVFLYSFSRALRLLTVFVDILNEFRQIFNFCGLSSKMAGRKWACGTVLPTTSSVQCQVQKILATPLIPMFLPFQLSSIGGFITNTSRTVLKSPLFN